jgi:hypothetical protein
MVCSLKIQKDSYVIKCTGLDQLPWELNYPDSKVKKGGLKEMLKTILS